MIRFILSLLFLSGTFASWAQLSDKCIVRIGSEKFSLQEFDYIFNKNNAVSQHPLTKKEYLELFVNYKLKVRAAQDAGLDTLSAFKAELDYYRNELAKPYLNDKKAEEEVLAEAYERLRWEIDASHILILVNNEATPADTLTAFELLMRVRRDIEHGADFSEMAKKYSQDPSAAQNGGRLGYFSAFQMVYPFETGAYQTPVGSLSGIVRSAYGYHLIKVHDKRPFTGEMHVAHIMKMFPQNATQQQRNDARLSIDSLYAKVLAGEEFSTLASLYSDDQYSAMNGGELPGFTKSRMEPAFAEVAFNLNNDGDVCPPMLTPFGWHIIKRINYKTLGTFDEECDHIRELVGNDERSLAGYKSLVAQLKKEYRYVLNQPLIDELMHLIDSQSDDSVFTESVAAMSGNLMTLDGKNISVSLFARFLKEHQFFGSQLNKTWLTERLVAFEEVHILDYEKSRLAVKYPEYRFLTQEYHDGLLVYEIGKQEVWDKATTDSIGLKHFYENNAQRYGRPFEEVRGVVVADYQDELENRWIAELRRKYQPKVYKNRVK